MPPSEPTRLAVLLFDGAPLGIISFAFGVFDLAVHYGAMPELDVRVVAGERSAVLSGGGLCLRLPYDLAAVEAADLVIVPNWRLPGKPPPERVLEALRVAHGRGARIAGLCSGAFVLAAAGLLDGRPATTHWAMARLLAQRYPKVRVRESVLFIDDGDVLTAGGGAAGLDLGLHLIRVLRGADIANQLARSIVVPPHRSGGQAQYIESPVPEPDLADPVGEAMRWALGRLHQLLSVDALARRANMSRRNFDRRFREITGATPANWLIHQRVIRAQELLERTGLPVDAVARQCGFSSGAALRPHFRKLVGVGPAAYRGTFGSNPS